MDKSADSLFQPNKPLNAGLTGVTEQTTARAIAAHKADMDFSYTTIDRIFRMSIGETGDYCAALYDGDYSLPLEDAQRRKHQYVLDAADIQPGQRILDIGCGWGGWLTFLKAQGIESMGITPSDGQVASCRRNGLDVHVMDYRSLTPESFGTFDVITAMGLFEHLCTIAEWRAGHQDEIYRNFFKIAQSLLRPGGRLYVQCTTFGRNMFPPEHMSLNAPKNSSEYLLALGAMNWTQLWLPSSDQQVLEAAAPYFSLKTQRNGRLDYVHTIMDWVKRMRKFTLPKYLAYASLVPMMLRNKEMYYRGIGMKYQPHRVLLEREVFDFHRFAFEKN
jgi:cyclopropane-fatty-acyl-phospholipid synthase